MEPRDYFGRERGEHLLLPGPAVDSAGGLYQPYTVRIDEIVPVHGGTDQRRFLLGHLFGLLLWLDRAYGDAVRVWLRGDLAATFRPDPVDLDVVALDGGVAVGEGDGWVSRVLATRPHLGPNAELVFDMIRADDDENVVKERRRSALRCKDEHGDPVLTGWWEVRI
jgi:hypothetical protein